jgi:hypothetical protein
MTRLRTLRAWAVAAPLMAALLGATSAARAQAEPPPESAARATLAAERVRVRAELDRVNAEIDALKQAGHGVRNDYRLRARLADAEALARRLTEIDARLGGSTAPAPAVRLGATPTLAPTDGPAEMDAKADILADQARRLGAEAVALDQRAQQLRARQELRRRSGLMDSDPFSPLEGSKRRGPTGTRTPPVIEGGNTQTTSPPPPGGTTTGTNSPGGFTTDIGQPSAPGSAPASGGARSVIAPAVPPTPTGVAGASDSAAPLSVQLRNVLDPATLVELRRLEGVGGARSNVEALERAAAALRARAERLQAQSQNLRARSHQPH